MARFPHVDGLIRWLAREYALKPGEGPHIKAALRLYNAHVEGHPPSPVAVAVGRVRRAVDGQIPGGLGHRRIAVRPTQGRYVVFSDHHVTHADHRHDVFGGNAGLYAAALSHYLADGWFLVENGDVEELVIFDPVTHPPFPGSPPGREMRFRRKMTVHELRTRRAICRPIQLRETLQNPDYQPIIDLQKQFLQADRWIRLAGNHDYDVQLTAFGEFRAVYGNHRPFDYLLLRDQPDQPRTTRFVVMHGHQFDANACPANAPVYGELISETLGVFFEGSDRVWRAWDDIDEWLLRRELYPNVLSTTPASSTTRSTLDGRLASAGPLDREALGPQGLLDIADAIESLFKAQVAWEYFESSVPMNALRNEVLTGNEWFKLRHTDELGIDVHLAAVFADWDDRPTLVLGHTHEPRILAAYPDRPGVAARYLNSGSAGRYEGLIWGLELEAGQPRIVSWVLDAAGHAERIPWDPVWVNGRRQLRPTRTVQPPQNEPDDLAEPAPVFDVGGDWPIG